MKELIRASLDWDEMRSLKPSMSGYVPVYGCDLTVISRLPTSIRDRAITHAGPTFVLPENSHVSRGVGDDRDLPELVSGTERFPPGVFASERIEESIPREDKGAERETTENMPSKDGLNIDVGKVTQSPSILSVYVPLDEENAMDSEIDRSLAHSAKERQPYVRRAMVILLCLIMLVAALFINRDRSSHVLVSKPDMQELKGNWGRDWASQIYDGVSPYGKAGLRYESQPVGESWPSFLESPVDKSSFDLTALDRDSAPVAGRLCDDSPPNICLVRFRNIHELIMADGQSESDRRSRLKDWFIQWLSSTTFVSAIEPTLLVSVSKELGVTGRQLLNLFTAKNGRILGKFRAAELDSLIRELEPDIYKLDSKSLKQLAKKVTRSNINMSSKAISILLNSSGELDNVTKLLLRGEHWLRGSRGQPASELVRESLNALGEETSYLRSRYLANLMWRICATEGGCGQSVSLGPGTPDTDGYFDILLKVNPAFRTRVGGGRLGWYERRLAQRMIQSLIYRSGGADRVGGKIPRFIPLSILSDSSRILELKQFALCWMDSVECSGEHIPFVSSSRSDFVFPKRNSQLGKNSGSSSNFAYWRDLGASIDDITIERYRPFLTPLRVENTGAITSGLAATQADAVLGPVYQEELYKNDIDTVVAVEEAIWWIQRQSAWDAFAVNFRDSKIGAFQSRCELIVSGELERNGLPCRRGDKQVAHEWRTSGGLTGTAAGTLFNADMKRLSQLGKELSEDPDGVGGDLLWATFYYGAERVREVREFVSLRAKEVRSRYASTFLNQYWYLALPDEDLALDLLDFNRQFSNRK